MSKYKGVEYLRKKLENKRTRVQKRYNYYEMKNVVRDLNMTAPAEVKNLYSMLGWCAKSVDCIADRLIFREFQNDNFDLTEIFLMNNHDIFYDNAILSALISSCSFIYISADKDGFPRLQVIDGSNATGILDPITGMLTEGYAVLERNDKDEAILEAHFTVGTTTFIRKNSKNIQIVKNNAPYPLLVPVIFKPNAKRPFGHSRITRACMSIVDSAIRTVKRSEISAEFYSFPQKYATGLSEDAEILDKWRASMSSLLTFTKDEDGDKPAIGQFTQQSMQPYIEQIRCFAALFAGETGLTLDDLGFVSDNPSSQEAIKASHESLRLVAKRAQRNFGSSFLNAGFLAACVRDNYTYERKQLYLTKPAWEPIFEPDASMLSSIGDGAIKINQAVPGYFNKDNLRSITGIEPSKMNAPLSVKE